MAFIDTLKAGQGIGGRTHQPTSVSLFMYNAAIWNPHRIHYDEPYTTGVEHHPGIVIDGPLQGDWLAQVVTGWLDSDAQGGTLIDFEYSNRKASYLGQTLTSGGAIETVDKATGEVRLVLHVKDEEGDITSPGSALVRFPV